MRVYLVSGGATLLLTALLLWAICGSGPTPLPEGRPAAARIAAGEKPLAALAPENPAGERDRAAAGRGEAGAPAKAEPAKAKSGTAEPTEAEKENGARVAEFFNTAVATLGGGWYGLPDVMLTLARVYQGGGEVIELPSPELPRKESRALLLPPPGLFSGEDAASLAALVETLDARLDAMLLDFRRLEGYAAWSGGPGEYYSGPDPDAVARGFTAEYAAYDAARAKYFALLGERAARVEESLLAGHPLRWQIIAARRIFGIFRQAYGQAAEPGARQAGELGAASRELKLLLAEAEKQPLKAPSALSRPYGLFLREAGRFSRNLEICLQEGSPDDALRELAASMSGGQAAYGAFAQAALAYRP